MAGHDQEPYPHFSCLAKMKANDSASLQASPASHSKLIWLKQDVLDVELGYGERLRQRLLERFRSKASSFMTNTGSVKTKIVERFTGWVAIGNRFVIL